MKAAFTFKHDKPTTHLFVPDEHYYPQDNFRRCVALGNLIADLQPDVIVRIGDMWDMPSLSSYDKGKKEMVFRNVREDIECGHHAESLIFKEMLKLNKTRSISKKKQYSPIIAKHLGNHEERVKRLLSYEPQWEGSLSMNDFRTRLPINEVVVPFQQMSIIDGIAYSHFFPSGVKGNPFASARALVMRTGMSCSMGHVHTLDHAMLTKPNGERIRGMFGGSFHDPEHKSFAGPMVDNLWWNGVIIKRNVTEGSYDLEEMSVSALIENYL